MPNKKLMDKEAAARIGSATAKKNDGQIPRGSFAATAQSVADKRTAKTAKGDK